MQNIRYIIKAKLCLILLLFAIILISFNFKCDTTSNNNKSKDQKYKFIIDSNDRMELVTPYNIKSIEYLYADKDFVKPKISKVLKLIMNKDFQQRVESIAKDSVFLKLKKEIVGTDKTKGDIIDKCIIGKTTNLDKYVPLYKNIRELKNILYPFIEEDEDLIRISGYCVNDDFEELIFVQVGFFYKNAVEVKNCSLYNPMSHTVLTKEIFNTTLLLTFNYDNLNRLGYYENKYTYGICFPIVYKGRYIADMSFTFMK